MHFDEVNILEAVIKIFNSRTKLTTSLEMLSFFLPNFSSTIDYRFYLSLLPEKLLIIFICLAILNAFSAKVEVKAGILLKSYLNYFSAFFFGAAFYWVCYLYGFSLNNTIFLF